MMVALSFHALRPVHPALPVGTEMPKKLRAQDSKEVPSADAADADVKFVRTTELPNHYQLEETINEEDGLQSPDDFRLIRDGKSLLSCDSAQKLDLMVLPTDPDPQLFYMDARTSGLNVATLPADGKPKFLLKNLPAGVYAYGKYKLSVRVGDLPMGVNLQPGDIFVNDHISYPEVALVRKGDALVPDAGQMWDPYYPTEDIAQATKFSYTPLPQRKSAPLTPLAISRVYEMIYHGEAKGGRQLLDLIYPHYRYLYVRLPFDYYFGSNAADNSYESAQRLTKDEVWKEMIAYLRKHSNYLPTLKELNPGLF